MMILMKIEVRIKEQDLFMHACLKMFCRKKLIINLTVLKKPIKTTVAAEAGGSRDHDPEEFTPGYVQTIILFLPNSRCDLIITDKKTDVGTCTRKIVSFICLGELMLIIRFCLDVYVNVQFCGILNDDIATDVELPMPFKGKTIIGELEVSFSYLFC